MSISSVGHNTTFWTLFINLLPVSAVYVSIVMLTLQWRIGKFIVTLRAVIHIYALIYISYHIIQYNGMVL
jgi:hypothetical protein